MTLCCVNLDNLSCEQAISDFCVKYELVILT